MKKLVDNYRIVLHTSDITLLEVKRQIIERVTATHREMCALGGNLARWQKAVPKMPPLPIATFDATQLGNSVFNHLLSFLTTEWGVIFHNALDVSPSKVFASYFDRKAPFDRENSKEFPDAFVILALKEWCDLQNDLIYVVTADQAFSRACDNDSKLLGIKDIHEVLTRGAADLGREGEDAAEKALEGPDFNASVQKILDEQLSDLAFLYVGDLAEGEVYDPQLISITEINDWSAIT